MYYGIVFKGTLQRLKKVGGFFCVIGNAMPTPIFCALLRCAHFELSQNNLVHPPHRSVYMHAIFLPRRTPFSIFNTYFETWMVLVSKKLPLKQLTDTFYHRML